ncbi:MAG: restriction endonuclease subunit S [Comamonas sp.]|nr:restriction endonuclease subunit S [Comamonas sp.]
MSSELYDAINLGDLINYKKGIAFKSKDYSDNGIPLIRVSNFHEDTLSPNDLKFLPRKIAEENKSVELKFSDIVVATVGSWPNNPSSVVGRVISVPKWSAGALMNQNSVILRAKDSDFYNQRYLFYCLKTKDFSNHIISKAQGSANQASITLDAIFSFPIFWSDYSHRQSVASFLTNIDDRITLLRETNTTLETIAQALFKSWFVDFDPVHAKQQGRAPEGMDAQTAALFPDYFEESELGMVPKGWRASNLGEIASFQNGYAFKSKDWKDSGHPVVKIGDVKPGIIDLSGCSFVSPSTLKGLDRFALFRGDLLVGMTGYVGETGLVPSHNPQAFLNQRVGRIAAKNKQACFEYIYCAIRNSGFKEFAVSQSHGSAQANVSGASILEYPIVLACEKIIDAFSGIVKVLIEKILTNHEQALALASCRDTLLPRLISGQLRLPEAQALVEDVVDA